MPSLIVIAGPNGSGKSSMFDTLIQKVPSFRRIPFINPDEIAKKLQGSYITGTTTQDNSLMLRAGREALKRRKKLLSSGESFGFETTLSGNSEMQLIKEAYALGYSINIVFIGLLNPYLSIMRVLMRVTDDGHHVDSEMIVRRYQRSLDHAIEVLPFVKRFYIFDNSGSSINMIASSKTVFSQNNVLRNVHVYQQTEGKWHETIVSYLKKRHETDVEVNISENITFDSKEIFLKI